MNQPRIGVRLSNRGQARQRYLNQFEDSMLLSALEVDGQSRAA